MPVKAYADLHFGSTRVAQLVLIDGQLYDVATDPQETTNLWRSEPGIVTKLYATLQKICGDESSGLPFDVSLRK
jgi:hypothetical protein